MKRIITNNTVMATLSFVVFGVGLLFSLYKNDFSWLSRSGALLVGIGIVILSRTFILDTEIRPVILAAETKLDVNDKYHYEKLGVEIPEYVHEQMRHKFALGKLGPIVSFFGTVIWGFGDLIKV